MCDCVGVLPGSHANTVTLPTPEHLIGTSLGCYTFRATTCVDRCIADEVQRLWALGIATTGSCCGHNVVPGYIGVMERYIPQMKALGYRVRPNEMDATREDGFYPMSTGDTVNTNATNPQPSVEQSAEQAISQRGPLVIWATEDGFSHAWGRLPSEEEQGYSTHDTLEELLGCVGRDIEGTDHA